MRWIRYPPTTEVSCWPEIILGTVLIGIFYRDQLFYICKRAEIEQLSDLHSKLMFVQ